MPLGGAIAKPVGIVRCPNAGITTLYFISADKSKPVASEVYCLGRIAVSVNLQTLATVRLSVSLIFGLSFYLILSFLIAN